MVDIERRRFPDRLDSKNLVAYTVTGENGDVIQQGMGRTLNLSEGGILIETHQHLADGRLSLLIGLKDDKFEVTAKCIHRKILDNGMNAAGIAFEEINGENLRRLKKWIEEFNRDKQS